MHSPKVTERVYVAAEDADAFVRALLAAHNVPAEDAAVIAGCLVSADLRGVDTRGLQFCRSTSIGCAAPWSIRVRFSIRAASRPSPRPSMALPPLLAMAADRGEAGE